MKLNQHVPSLKTSQTLNRLLIEKGKEVPESLFMWVQNNEGEEWFCRSDFEFKGVAGQKCIPAYLSSESGEMLPEDTYITIKKDGKWTCEDFRARCWFDDGGNYPRKAPYCEATTEAEARALMRIYLLTNNLI